MDSNDYLKPDLLPFYCRWLQSTIENSEENI